MDLCRYYSRRHRTNKRKSQGVDCILWARGEIVVTHTQADEPFRSWAYYRIYQLLQMLVGVQNVVLLYFYFFGLALQSA